MSRKKKGVSSAERAIPLSLPFMEDAGSFGTPADILRCRGARLVLDTETTGLEWWRDQLVGVAVWCPERAVRTFVPCLDYAEKQDVKRAVAELAESDDTRVTFHNAKFDAHFLDVDLGRAAWQHNDTAVMSHLFDSRMPKNLGALERHWLGTTTKTHTRGNSAEVHTMPLGVMAEYAINDCRITYEVEDILMPKLVELKLDRLLRKDMRYQGTLWGVERAGLRLNLERIRSSTAVMRSRLRELEAELIRKVGRRFNWQSDDELSHALYDWMGYERPKNPYADEDGVDRSKFADRGKYNATMVSGFILTEKVHHPLGELVSVMRETNVLAGTQERWLELADGDRLHPSYNETGTRTGRLSSSPNVQNIASDYRARTMTTEYSVGGNVREAEYNLRLSLLPDDDDEVLVSIDHRQQEMRLFAILANEPAMIETLRRREDIHRNNALVVWAEEIARDPSMLAVRREHSKVIGFALVYGGTTGSIAHRLNKTFEEARAIADAYWARFPRIKPFLAECVAICRKHGYLRYWSSRIWREENEEFMYKGANALVQGGSADLLSIAAMRCNEQLREFGAGRLVNLVHDELVFSIPRNRVDDISPSLVTGMEVEDLFGVPFATDMKVGVNYGQLEKWEGVVQ